MRKDFAESLVWLCSNGTLSSEFLKEWLVSRNKQGKINNLDYIECLNALNEYDRNNKTRTESI